MLVIPGLAEEKKRRKKYDERENIEVKMLQSLQGTRSIIGTRPKSLEGALGHRDRRAPARGSSCSPLSLSFSLRCNQRATPIGHEVFAAGNAHTCTSNYTTEILSPLLSPRASQQFTPGAPAAPPSLPSPSGHGFTPAISNTVLLVLSARVCQRLWRPTIADPFAPRVFSDLLTLLYFSLSLFNPR